MSALQPQPITPNSPQPQRLPPGPAPKRKQALQSLTHPKPKTGGEHLKRGGAFSPSEKDDPEVDELLALYPPEEDSEKAGDETSDSGQNDLKKKALPKPTPKPKRFDTRFPLRKCVRILLDALTWMRSAPTNFALHEFLEKELKPPVDPNVFRENHCSHASTLVIRTLLDRLKELGIRNLESLGVAGVTHHQAMAFAMRIRGVRDQHVEVEQGGKTLGLVGVVVIPGALQPVVAGRDVAIECREVPAELAGRTGGVIRQAGTDLVRVGRVQPS